MKKNKIALLTVIVLMIVPIMDQGVVYGQEKPVQIVTLPDLKPGVDAVLLTEDDFNQKSALTELAKTKVILYKGYINVLTEGLNPDLQILVEKDIPEFRTENTIPVVSGLTIRNGRLFFGSWYVEKGRGTLTDEQEQMMYESYAFYILDVAEEYSGLIPQPVQTTSYNFRISLPLVINNKSQQWDPWPILINVIDYCPEGQYVDVMDTRKGVDQNPDWDWWATQVRQQVIPGVVGCGDASWTSSRIHNRIAPQAMGVLFDYDPTTVADNPYTPVGLKVSSGLAQTLVDLVWNWLFSTQDVSVLDYSSYVENWMEQEFIFSGVQRYTTNQSKPGLAVQMYESYSPLYYRPINIYFLWHGWAEYHHFDTWWVGY